MLFRAHCLRIRGSRDCSLIRVHFFCAIVLHPIPLLPTISSLPSSTCLRARAKLSVKPLQPASSLMHSVQNQIRVNHIATSCTSYKEVRIVKAHFELECLDSKAFNEDGKATHASMLAIQFNLDRCLRSIMHPADHWDIRHMSTYPYQLCKNRNIYIKILR
jgi:hypothetical protein